MEPSGASSPTHREGQTVTDRAAFEAWWGHTPDRKDEGYLAHNVNVRWEAWRDAWQEAARQEREAILAAVAGVQEKEWYGHDNPYIFEDGKQAAIEAIRSRPS
jgi:hypothetical protein